MTALRIAIACAALAAGVLGCGATPGATTHGSGGTAEKLPPVADRAGALLDEWSADVETGIFGRGAHRQARRSLEKVKKFGMRARVIMSPYPADAMTRAVIADGDAWTKFALMTESKEASLGAALKLAKQGATAWAAHEAAYQLSGHKPPPFWRDDQHH
jgi:hypothetical protein